MKVRWQTWSYPPCLQSTLLSHTQPGNSGKVSMRTGTLHWLWRKGNWYSGKKMLWGFSGTRKQGQQLWGNVGDNLLPDNLALSPSFPLVPPFNHSASSFSFDSLCSSLYFPVFFLGGGGIYSLLVPSSQSSVPLTDPPHQYPPLCSFNLAHHPGRPPGSSSPTFDVTLQGSLLEIL